MKGRGRGCGHCGGRALPVHDQGRQPVGCRSGRGIRRQVCACHYCCHQRGIVFMMAAARPRARAARPTAPRKLRRNARPAARLPAHPEHMPHVPTPPRVCTRGLVDVDGAVWPTKGGCCTGCILSCKLSTGLKLSLLSPLLKLLSLAPTDNLLSLAPTAYWPLFFPTGLSSSLLASLLLLS